MCKSAADGGQRCASHTRPAYHQATLGTPEWDAAAAAYGSTRLGRIELRAYQAAAVERGDTLAVVAYDHALAEGLRQREKTAAFLTATTGTEPNLPPADRPTNWRGDVWIDPSDGSEHNAGHISSYRYDRDTGRDYRLIALYRDLGTLPHRSKTNVPNGTLYVYDQWGRCALYAPITDQPAPTAPPTTAGPSTGAIPAASPAVTHRLLADSAAVIDKVAATGGLTVSPTGTEPTTGFCINEVGDCPKIPEADFFNHNTGHQALDAFLTDHADWFTGDNAKHVGIWHDTTNGVVVLDRVDVIATRDDAIRIGHERHQRSIWDVENQTEIPLT